ncbi:MAG: class I SAM-dependent rRNA methyltransferase [Bryobacteraceae bacterium]
MTVRVNRKAARRVASGHLWIFASDVVDKGEAQAGEAVRVVDLKGKPLGMAHFSAASQIALRLLTRGGEEIGREFFARRLAAAEAHRRRVVRDTDAYRVVHGEGDLLPGLIVDRYADWLVVQTLNQGMDRARPWIVDALIEIFAPRGIVARNDAAVRAREALALESGVVYGDVPESVEVHMNGLRLDADLLHGQKTGMFLDQRENYPAAARHARGKALDCFSSTGGFALHLASVCPSVEALDSSGAALATAARNAALNGISNIEFRETDIFVALASYASARRQYGTVVLDPPAFAKSRSTVEGALGAYKEINLRALRMLEPGGILITCSCSQRVSEADFLELIAQASLDAGRQLRVLERRTQSQDHPILLTVPETHYLKCIILEVL